MKTTYVLGAGASYHAGYPLCSELWPKMATWVIESQPSDSEYRRAVDTIADLNGPVVDVEGMFTNLEFGDGVFKVRAEDQRGKLRGKILRCLRDYFKSISDLGLPSPLYDVFAKKVELGDRIVTFNYDVSLESALIKAGRFRVKNGYGTSFVAQWDEPDSEVTVLKLHGSINWVGLPFGGVVGGPRAFRNSLGARPFVDNADSLLPKYPKGVLDRNFPGGGVTGGAVTLILPTYHKKYSVKTSVGDEWSPFYKSLWSQAAESLEQSERIFLIGYSMPEADHRSRAVLLSNGNKRAEVLLCCASSNESLRRTFEAHGFSCVREIGSFETAFA